MMRQIEDHLDLDALLELKPREAGEFCESVLDVDILVEELEKFGPFAPIRRNFCQFLEIGESTLTGWLKGGRVPRTAKVAYVLLVALTKLQAEVKRLRQDMHDLKIVQSGETFQVVLFEADETGISVGRIVACGIPNATTARILAGSVKAFRMLDETRDVIGEMLERTENAGYIDHLRDLDTRILKETVAAFEPEKWRELFGPYEIDIDVGEFLKQADRRHESRESFEPNMTLDNTSSPSGRGEPDEHPERARQEE